MRRLCYAEVLRGVNTVVDRVCAITAEYEEVGEMEIDTVLDAHVQCMSVACALWVEVSDLVHVRFTPGKLTASFT
jgi:hypothetical protein